MPPVTPKLLLRAAILGVAVVLIQVAAVSQVLLFGTNADLTPLVVAAVGLLCGSLPGAIFGFAVGLFVDTALVQTMGLSSLVFVVAGYWAGRLRELRDPQAAVVPMIVGAVATAVTTIGYGLMNFLLGIDAPVSFLLLRADPGDDRAQRADRAARLRARAPLAVARPARGSAPPPAPRLHHRRPVSAEPRLMPLDPANDRRPPVTPQMALRVAGVGVLAFVLFGIVFFRLWYLQVLDGDKYLAQARENRVRTERIQAPRGQIVDRQQPQDRRQPPGDRRRRSTRARSRWPCAPRSPPTGQAITARDKRPKGQEGTAPGAAGGHRGHRDAVPAPGHACCRCRRETINQRRRHLDPAGALRRRADQDRRRPLPARLPRASTRSSSRASRSTRSTCAPIPIARSPHSSSAAIGEISETQLKNKAYKGITAGTFIGQTGLEVRVRQVPARRATARTGSRSTPPASGAAPSPRATPSPGAQLQADARPRPPAEGRAGTSARPAAASRARSWR